MATRSNHQQISWLVFHRLACTKIAVRALLSPLFDAFRRIRIPPSPPLLQITPQITKSPTVITTVLSFLWHFPVFGSPTATIEVVGNTGTMSSEKAGVSGSTPNPGTTFQVMRAEFHVLRKPRALFIRRQIACGCGESAASNLGRT